MYTRHKIRRILSNNGKTIIEGQRTIHTVKTEADGMKVLEIKKEDWANGLNKIEKSCRLLGPQKDGKFHNFKELGRGELPDFNFRNTRLSPKSIVYPQSEKMFDYTLDQNDPDHNILKEAEKDYSPQVVMGIRPCDAKAFSLVKLNFDTPEYKDTYWLKRFESTTLVGLACHNPCSSCFCTSAGTGPFHTEALDMLLVQDNDRFLAQVLTEKGEALAKTAGWTTKASSDAQAQITVMKETAEGRITSFISAENLKNKSAMEIYEDPYWEDVSFSCINCGTCTYLCPTCWCFDVQDETCGNCGIRMRNWDSCMYPLFSLHGSGHNPRGQKLQRVRQRFMHKLKYFLDKYDEGIQCVGCGRCVRFCPVNIDIRRVCELMNRSEACPVTI
jgi:sulfhydrogenase subunit beta (sulfur reductase)